MARQDITNLYNTTKYIVDASDSSTYTTIQAAIDAANIAGGNAIVYIRAGGSYTEDLTLYSTVHIQGAGKESVTIIGRHTPPTAGSFKVSDCKLQSATHVFSSGAAGTATLTTQRCEIAITNGYLYSMISWTGNLNIDNCNSTGTQDGVINASATVNINNSNVGVGINNPTGLFGSITITNSTIGSNLLLAGSATSIIRNSVVTQIIQTSGTNTLSIYNSFLSGTTAVISHFSASPITLSNVIINSSADPVITGSGTIVISNISFLNGKNMASGIVQNFDAATGLLSPFIVGLYGNFSTIQAAIDEANAIGNPTTILIQPGGYTEDLTLRNDINLEGIGDASNITITGTHTPPASGKWSAQNIKFVNASSLLISGVAGTADITLDNCLCDIEGFIFDAGSWAGTLTLNNVNSSLSTNTGIMANASGSTTVLATNSVFGPSASRINTFYADADFNSCQMDGIIRMGSSASLLAKDCHFKETIQFLNSSTGNLLNSFLDSGTASAISTESVGIVKLNNITINSSNANVITGSGAVTFGAVNYLNGTNINATVTKNYTNRQELGALKLSDALNGFLYATNGVVSTNAIPSGHDIQIKFSLKQTWQAITNTMSVTTPTNTDGAEVLTVTITPISVFSTFMIVFNTFFSIGDNTSVGQVALFRDTAVNTITAQVLETGDNIQSLQGGTFIYYDPVAYSGATTYKIRMGANIGNLYINGDSGGQWFSGGVGTTTLAVIEIPTGS